ncbi:MAG: hypothetical protein ACREEM_53395 [Blastocatellia bacterium]
MHHSIPSYCEFSLCPPTNTERWSARARDRWLLVGRTRGAFADGLAHNTVISTHQDKKGYVWLSTFEGLSRFDGYHFVNYGADGVKLFHEKFPQLEIVMLTVLAEQEKIFASICNGACGYLLKETPPAKLSATTSAL